MTKLHALSLLGVFALAATTSGCTVHTVDPDPDYWEEEPYYDPGPDVTVSAGVTWRPMIYAGYVVYYDPFGTPFILVDGHRHYVPRTYRHYDRLSRHYHANPRAYHDWYGREGHRHTNRRPVRRHHR